MQTSSSQRKDHLRGKENFPPRRMGREVLPNTQIGQDGQIPGLSFCSLSGLGALVPGQEEALYAQYAWTNTHQLSHF